MFLTGFRCITLLNNCIISEKHYMALLYRVVAAPWSSCVAAARWFSWVSRNRLTKLRLQCKSVSSKGNSGVSMYSHGLGCNNLVARIMGRYGVSRRWSRHRDRKGGGVCSVHLLYSGVTNICLCGFPLTVGGVGIWLCLYRWLATSVGVVG